MTTVRIFAKLAAAMTAALPFAAQAGSTTNDVPEPASWALVALAGVIGCVIVRNKRK